jgi:hypothetical protein
MVTVCINLVRHLISIRDFISLRHTPLRILRSFILAQYVKSIYVLRIAFLSYPNINGDVRTYSVFQLVDTRSREHASDLDEVQHIIDQVVELVNKDEPILIDGLDDDDDVIKPPKKQSLPVNNSQKLY